MFCSSYCEPTIISYFALLFRKLLNLLSAFMQIFRFLFCHHHQLYKKKKLPT